jgi:hypothetical protein
LMAVRGERLTAFFAERTKKGRHPVRGAAFLFSMVVVLGQFQL